LSFIGGTRLDHVETLVEDVGGVDVFGGVRQSEGGHLQQFVGEFD